MPLAIYSVSALANGTWEKLKNEYRRPPACEVRGEGVVKLNLFDLLGPFLMLFAFMIVAVIWSLLLLLWMICSNSVAAQVARERWKSFKWGEVGERSFGRRRSLSPDRRNSKEGSDARASNTAIASALDVSEREENPLRA